MRHSVMVVAVGCLAALAFLGFTSVAEARGGCGKRMMGTSGSASCCQKNMASSAQPATGASCCQTQASAPSRAAAQTPSCCEPMTLAQAQPQLGDDLSPAQKQRFDGKKTQLKRELGVCKEHCGQDEACGKKCDDTYKARLENEYKTAKDMKPQGT